MVGDGGENDSPLHHDGEVNYMLQDGILLRCTLPLHSQLHFPLTQQGEPAIRIIVFIIVTVIYSLLTKIIIFL